MQSAAAFSAPNSLLMQLSGLHTTDADLLTVRLLRERDRDNYALVKIALQQSHFHKSSHSVFLLHCQRVDRS